MLHHLRISPLRICHLPIWRAGLLAATLLLPAMARAQEVGPPVRDDRRNVFRKYVLNWKDIRNYAVVMQQRDYSCGAAALATLLKYYWGDDFTEKYLLEELDNLLKPEEIRDRLQNGLTLTDLRKLAVELKYQATIGKLDINKLSQAKVPLVVGIEVNEYKHFVVYRGMDDRYVYLADPIRGNIRTPIAEFQQQWQRNSVLAVAKPGEQLKDTTPLTVTEAEKSLGRLNRQTVRRNYLAPILAFPRSLSP